MTPFVLPDATRAKLDQFKAELMAWNRVHNLTGAKTPEQIEAQIVDSLYPITFLPQTPDSLLDIGTGAGFPGMILAIAWPETETLLCEPLQKRAAFLRHIARSLDLTNVRVEAKRVEALEPRPFALITSRAVTATCTLIAWCRPFIDEKSQLLFYKGERAAEEAAGLEACDIETITRQKRQYLWIKEPMTCSNFF